MYIFILVVFTPDFLLSSSLTLLWVPLFLSSFIPLSLSLCVCVCVCVFLHACAYIFMCACKYDPLSLSRAACIS